MESLLRTRVGEFTISSAMKITEIEAAVKNGTLESCFSQVNPDSDMKKNLLDKEDYVEGSYIFEVSSPGLGRTLKKDKHLQMSLGEDVELKTFQPVEKQKEFEGVLKAFDDETVTIEEEDGKERIFQRKDIALIRLAFHF